MEKGGENPTNSIVFLSFLHCKISKLNKDDDNCDNRNGGNTKHRNQYDWGKNKAEKNKEDKALAGRPRLAVDAPRRKRRRCKLIPSVRPAFYTPCSRTSAWMSPPILPGASPEDSGRGCRVRQRREMKTVAEVAL